MNYPIDVDSGGYTTACDEFYNANHGIIDATGPLWDALGSGGSMAGRDSGGQEWATQYDAAAKPLLQAGADVGEAMGQMGNLLNASLKNHRGADYGAMLAGPPSMPQEDGDSDPNHWTETTSIPAPPSAKGGTGDMPGWLHWVIDHLEGLIWPDADTGRMRTVGNAWITAGDTFRLYTPNIDAASSLIGAQTSPEVPDAVAACSELKGHLGDIADAYQQIGKACNDYAQHVDDHHKMIEDELESFIKWTIGIEVGGAILGAVTLGLGEGAAQAAEAAEVANAASKVVKILRALLELAKTVAETIGTLLVKLGKVLERLKKFLGAKVEEALAKIAELLPSTVKGLSKAAAEDAYVGMNKGGGHAMQHFIEDGLLADKGSVATKLEKFKELTRGILESPVKTFQWKIGGTMSDAYAGIVNGKRVVIFVAAEGPYAGKVLSAVVPGAANIAKWGL